MNKYKGAGRWRTALPHKKISWWIFWSASIALAAILGIGAWLFFTIQSLPAPDQFQARQVRQSTKLYDRTGEHLLYEIHGLEKRTVLSFEDIPHYMKNATLAAENAEFYRQPAFDWRAIMRAFLANLKEGRRVQGGSTITQQLAKNVFLTSEKTYLRKIKELILALELEKRYSKDEILGFYLNQIPYGSNAYGVEAASQVYFAKSIKEVSIAEAATLAALLKAPSYYSPWGSHSADLLARKDYVLDRMAELGTLSTEERDRAKKERIVFTVPSLGTIVAPHFSLAVKEYLIERYGAEAVESGGLRVITTLDAELQGLAEIAVRDGSARNLALYGSANAALVAQDPKTGQVLALVGSKDYFSPPEPAGCTPGLTCQFEGNFNVAIQGLRQPGSALKPFVYLTAFENGYSPETVLFDVPTEFDTRNDPATSYRPVNFDGTTRGPIKMQSALAESLNIPAVKTLYLAGFDNVLKKLHAYGITTLQERWRYGLSLTLGGGEVKLIDLVNAYASLSQNGIRHRQALVLRVENAEGRVLEEYRDDAVRADDGAAAKTITRILSDPDLRYPIFRSSNALTIFPDHEVALKTGTSEDHRDAWTVGYTPFLTVGVWAGNNNNQQMIRQGSSILAAVPIWHAFIKEALAKYAPEPFEHPAPPATILKPMLNGTWDVAARDGGVISRHAHSILFYVDRNDPAGPIPTHPENDPQFQNWEDTVLAWARANIQGFSLTYNKPLSDNASFSSETLPPLSPAVSTGDLLIDQLKPENGSFVDTPLVVTAALRAGSANLARAELYFNRRLIHALPLSGNAYFYRYAVPVVLEPQNSVELKIYDLKENNASRTVIFYSKR
ncbi:MAG: transglycosylase domain-containing protein [Candidatus Brennerbacteria bacterium]|nr:transglycosylase domain-containing protein [Candidatus Brennerbacteria bacterium]